MAWRTRLATAGWFVSYFTNKEIRGFADDIPSFFGNCPTSCANGVGVQLDANAALRPQHRIIHELGHTSIQVSQAWTPATLGSNNCYMKDGVNGWNFQNNEWACSGFEEGFATLLADTTLYQPNAVAPHSCLSSGACATNSFNIETSTASGSCSTNEASWPLTHIRYLWDVYDSVNDGETISEGTANWWRLYRTYQHYPSGTGNHAADEHWNSTYTALDSTDGRGSRDYEWNYDNSYSLDTTTARSNNCNPL
jgi:hypothetical protein